MRPKRVLITGAAGFVGRHLLRASRETWPEATLLAACRRSDLPQAGLPEADRVLAFDLLQPLTIAAALQEARPDACIHLAAWADVAASFGDAAGVWRANVDGSLALAAAIGEHVPDCLLVHAGSAEIYGLAFREGRELDENTAPRPANPYAASKAAIDLAFGEMALRGLRVIRMRPLNHVGPGQSARFAVSGFARQIARIERGIQPPILRTGALDRVRDFLDVRDVCAAYLGAIAAAEGLEPGAVFNLASGTPRRLGAVLEDLLCAAGIAPRIETDEAALRPLDLAVTSCAAEAARSTLRWVPVVPWLRTLADILAFWREPANEKLSRRP